MRKTVLYLITLYKKYFSPLKGPPTCIFIPSCSEYAYQAVEKYGVIKGGMKAIWRILRCNPFNKGGYDPLE